MAGHSKWSQIKRKKAVNDKERSKSISKHIRAIQSAVREGGSGEASNNLFLKNALTAAKSDSVPIDNIERAIERALGGAEGGGYETVFYEGYGPAGVAVLVEVLTDNRHRTAADVRHVFSKHGGNMSGSTLWQFELRGVIVLEQASEHAQELAIELGAQDLEQDEDGLTIYTDASDLYTVSEGLAAKGLEPSMHQLTRLPQTETFLETADAEKAARFLEALEALDDVQNVYSTANLEGLDVVH